MSFLWSVLGFVVAMGVLVTIHEWGHYITARLLGVKVEKFSIGFGKVIYSKRWRNTDFQLALIPLGGYVKFLDERDASNPNQDFQQAFNRQSVLKRFAVVAAGPIINLLFAWLLFSLLYFSGMTGYKPVMEQSLANSPVSSVLGEKFPALMVNSVANHHVTSWKEVNQQILLALADGKQKVSISLTPFSAILPLKNEKLYSVQIPLTSLDINETNKGLLKQLGFVAKLPNLSPMLGSVKKDSPADLAGFQIKDKILSVNGNHINSWSGFVKIIRASAGKILSIQFDRLGVEKSVQVEIQPRQLGAATYGFFGASAFYDEAVFKPYQSITDYGLLESFKLGYGHSVQLIDMTLSMISRMFVGEVKLSNLSGPISIADYSGKALQSGWFSFFMLLALLSLSLGVLNLLPIPVLDGGHLALYSIEIIKGSPVSEVAQVVLQKIGLVLILSLTFFAIFNDVVRISNV